MPNNLFIISAGKSGSTLLQALMDWHPELLVLPVESNYWDTIVKQDDKKDYILNKSKMAWMKDSIYTKHNTEKQRDFTNVDWNKFSGWFKASYDLKYNDRSLYRHIFECYGYAIEQDPYSKKYYVDKTPSHLPYVDLIKQERPGSKFIHLLRNPYDNYWAIKSNRTRLGSWNSAVAEKQMELLQLSMKVAKEHADDPNWKILYYEDIVTDPEVTMKSLARWLGIEFNDSMLVPTLAGKFWGGNSSARIVFDSIDKSRIGQGKKNLTEEEIEYVMVAINRSQVVGKSSGLKKI